MKVLVIGVGAIGGLLAVKFALAGADVSVVDQGEHLEAIRNNGLTLINVDGKKDLIFPTAILNRVADATPVDLIVLGLKAHDLPLAVNGLSSACHMQTKIMSVQNGLPWWYFQRHGGLWEGTQLRSLDTDNVLGKNISPERIIGCVAYPAAVVLKAGVVQVVEGNRLAVGELNGHSTPCVTAIADMLQCGGLKSLVVPNIRDEIWLKAWGTLAFNPISALTRATMVDICQTPQTRALVIDMMREAEGIAIKLGVTFRVSLEKRLAGAEAVGLHKTSMLQDLEAGRTMEIEAVIGVMSELARLTSTPCPKIDAVYALVKLLSEQSLKSSGG